MPDAPFRLQLALQGGGAKLVYLLAALHAIEKLQKANIVEVTRVAGTSAGAIAGALFAAGVEMETAKELLRGFRQHLDALPIPSLRRIANRVLLRRKPIAEVEPIENELKRIFEKRGFNTMADFKHPQMLIMSADLLKGKTHVADADETVVDALLDSFAIPLYFRLWNHPRGSRVDGGICENLPIISQEPSEPLKQDTSYGPVIGISFERMSVGTKELSGAVGYLIAVLDTAIHNSVERARQQLGSDNVILIRPRFGTFDFQQALDDNGGLGDTFDKTSEQVHRDLERYVSTSKQKSKTPIDPDVWQAQNVDTMRRLGEIYELQHESQKYRLIRAAFIVQANCLLKEGEPQFGQPDFVRYEIEFQVLDEPVYCQKLSLTLAEGSRSRGQAVVQIYHANGGPPIVSTVIPVLTPSTSQKLKVIPVNAALAPIREMVAYFNPVLPPHSGPYRLVLDEWVESAMGPLSRGEPDNLFMGSHLRSAGPVGRAELILHLPRSFGRLEILPPDPAEQNQPTPMSLPELAPYSVLGGHFAQMGWECVKAAPDHSFSIRFRRSARN